MAIEIEIKPSAESVKSIAELRKEMKELKDEQARAVQGSEEWTKAAARIGEIKDSLAAANEQAKIFAAGTEFEKSKNAISSLKEGISGLDFGKAKESVSALGNVVKNIKVSTLKDQVKDLTGTFKGLGQVIKANPILLLASVITAIIVAIVDILNKGGAFKKMFEIWEKAIGAVVDILKQFTDFLGLTNFAAQDAADKQAKAAKDAADAYEKNNTRIINSLDAEIAILKASGDESDATFKKIEEAERQKVVLLSQTALARFREAQAALKAAVLKGDLDASEIQALKDKQDELFNLALKAENDIKVFDAQSAARSKAREDKKDTDAENRERKRQEAAKKRRDANLQATRRAEDLNNSLIKDATERELAQIKTDYARQIEEVEKNELLKASVRKDLIEKLQAAQAAAEAKVREDARIKAEAQAEEDRKKEEDRVKAEAQRAFQAQQNIDQILLESRKMNLKNIEDSEDLSTQQRVQRSQAREEELINIQRIALQEQLQNLKNSLDNKEITQEEFDAQSALLTLQTQQSITEIEKTEAEKRKKLFDDEQKAKVESYKKLFQSFTQIVNSLADFQKARFEEDLASIDQQAKRQQDSLRARYEQGLITKEEYEQQNTELTKKAEAQQLEVRRKAFESEKKMKIAQAAIAGFSGAVSAFSGAMSLGPIAGPVVGSILAGLVAATTALNISKIQKTQFDGGGSSNPSSPQPGSLSSSVTQPATPTFLGSGNRNNTASPNASVQNNQMFTVKAVISESELTSTQDRVSRMNANAEL